MLSILALALPLFHAAQQTPAQGWAPGPGTPGVVYATSGSGSATDRVGAVLTVGSASAPATAFGSLAGSVAADSFRGHRIRLVADIDARNVTGGASPWLRVEGAAGVLMFDNAADRAIKGTATGHIETTLFVPQAATRIVFGLLVSGSGEATARGLRIAAQPLAASSAPVAVSAKRVLDSAYVLVRRYSLWRDTVTWSSVEPEFRAIAAGASTPAEGYPAIRYLLRRLGDHHSFLMLPTGAASFRTGGAANPRAEVRLQEEGIGYVSGPAYSGAEQKATVTYAKTLQDSLRAILPHASCRWIVDLRDNGGGNMWPMLGGLRPFLGESGLGSFVSAEGSAPLWHARDAVNVKPKGQLKSLEFAYVAVLTSPRTGSSGEAVTISFRGRPRTRSFGLPTAGLSTANQEYALPDSSMIFLTVSVEADRTGKRYGERIEPDEIVPVGSAGSGSDPQVEHAIAWLKSQPRCEIR